VPPSLQLDPALPTGPSPIAVQVGLIDSNTTPDMAVLGATGQLTVALNNGNNYWGKVQTVDLGLNPANGMVLGRFSSGPFNDLAVQGANGIFLERGDGIGDFARVQTLTPVAPGALAPSTGGPVQMAAALLNGGPVESLITVAPGANEVLVFPGQVNGMLGTPDIYASGGSQPVAVVVGDFVGDALPDLAVGHRDGSVTFFQGLPGGKFLARPDLTVTGLGSVVSMATGNFDGTGTEIAVSGTSGVFILKNSHYLIDPANPIVNGNFAEGLTAWTVSSGIVTASNGLAQFQEDPTALTSTLAQTFVVPNHPGTLSFDLVALGLENPQGGVPDAFEASLVDGQQNSLVPTFEPQATSFINFNPGGAVAKASGVTFDGRHVTLDISQLAPGTKATVVFDLVGNPPGTSSTATIANVQVSQQPIPENFQVVALPGPFGTTAGIAAGDVNGDGHTDLVVADTGLDGAIAYYGDGQGNFTRTFTSASPFGVGASAIALGKLVAGTTADNVALTLAGSNLVLDPLIYDATPPQVTFLSPAPGAMLDTNVAQLQVQFSKAVQDAGPTGTHSVTNPASYALVNLTTGQTVPIASVSYNATTFIATLTIASGLAPLADGKYQVTVKGSDPVNSIQSLGGVSLGGGVDAQSTFIVERTAPAVTLTLSPNLLWPPNHKFVTIQAQLNIQDPLDPHPTVTLLSITENETPAGPGNHSPDIQNANFGTDDRTFDLRAERLGNGGDRIYTVTYFVRNAAGNGRIVSADAVVPHDQGEGLALLNSLGNPTAPGLGGLQTTAVTQINNFAYQIGNTQNGTISQAGQVDVYSFSATAGQQLFFNALSGSSTALHWFLTDPSGTIVFSSDFSDHDTVTLAKTGTYYLTVDARNNQVGAYQFKVWNVPAPTATPINIGQVVNGTVTIPGSQALYTFAGTAGQKLFFDVQGSASGALAFTVLGPTGAPVLTASNQNLNNAFLLPTTGTYSVVVGHGTTLAATGSFQFQLDALPAVVPQTISLNTPITGALTVPGQTAVYTFQANLGQQIQFNVSNNSGGAVNFTLTDPTGKVLFVGLTVNQFLSSLPATGTYTLSVQASGDQTGSYGFQFVDQTAMAPTTGTVNLSSVSTLPATVVNGRHVGPIDFSHLQDITPLGQLAYHVTTFNLHAQSLYTEVTLTNASANPLGNEVVAEFHTFAPPSSYLVDPDALDPQGDGAILFSNELGPQGSQPGSTSAPIMLQFGSPAGVPFSFEVSLLAPANQPPVFTSTPIVQALTGSPYQYAATATDPDGDPLTFQLLVGPAGMTVNPQTGLVQWTPSASQAGNQDVTLTVSDSRGGTATQTYVLQVQPPGIDRPMIVSTPSPTSVLVGQTFIYDVEALDPDNDTLTYTLTTAPAGMTISLAGQVSWTPTAADLGQQPVTIRVDDGVGGFDTQSFTLTVTNAAPGQIDGLKFNDLNGNGVRDIGVGGSIPNGSMLVSNFANYEPDVQRFDPATGIYAGALVPQFSGNILNAAGMALGADGNLYVAGYGSNAVYRYDGRTGAFLGPNPFAIGNISNPDGLAFGPDGNLYVSGFNSNNIVRYDGRTGAFLNVFASGGGLDGASGFVFGPDGNLYVAGYRSNSVVRFDGRTGAFIDDFVMAGSGGLSGAHDVAFGPDGNLYVTSSLTNSVLRYNGHTGVFLDTFASGSGLGNPYGLSFGPDGNLYVVSWGNNEVMRFDGHTGHFLSTAGTSGTLLDPAYVLFVPAGVGTGAGGVGATGVVPNLLVDNWGGHNVLSYDATRGLFAGAFVGATSGGLLGPEGMAIGADGNLYVASYNNNAIYRYDGQTGAFLDIFASTPPGISQPNDILFGPDGNLYLDTFNNTAVYRFDHTGAYLGQFTSGFDLVNGAGGMAFGPDGNLYVCSLNSQSVEEYNGTTGAFISHFVPAGSNNIGRAENLTFGPDGNLYVSSRGNEAVLRYDGRTGAFLGIFASGGGLTYPGGLAFGPDGNLYVTSEFNNTVLRFDGHTGAFLGIAAPSDGLNVPSYLLFMPPGFGSHAGGSVTFTKISTNFNNPIGIDYYQPNNSVVVSVNYSGGQPHNFEQIQPDGSHVQFSSASGFTDEVYIATVRSGQMGGWTVGDLFVGNGQFGQIVRITNGGNTVINPWVTLPGSGGLFRGKLIFDQTGLYGGDLIALTTNGEVWRINSAGQPTFLANVNSVYPQVSYIEGLVVVPNDAVRYGPLAGKIVVGTEYNGGIYTVDALGHVVFYQLNLPQIEDLKIIPANQNFFGVNYGSSTVLGVSAAQWTPFVGDILVTQEYHSSYTSGLLRLLWNGNNFEEVPLDIGPGSATNVNQWEGVNFAPAGVSEVPPVSNEPGLPGWTIYLDTNNNGKLDPGEPFTVTDAQGNYSFKNLAPGTYTVAEVPQPGWVQTAPASKTYTVTVGSGQDITGNIFGNQHVNVPDTAPAFTSTPPTTATVGQLYRYNATAADLDGDPFTFSLASAPVGMALDPISGTLVWVPTADELGPQQVVLRVIDSHGSSAQQTFTVQVAPNTFALSITSTPPLIATVGAAYSYQVTTSDMAGLTPTFSLLTAPSGMAIDPASGLLTWTPATVDLGPHSVIVRAVDAAGNTAYQGYQLTVRVPSVASTIYSKPVLTATAGALYQYHALAVDPSDGFTFQLVNPPPGMTIDPQTGLVSWTPAIADIGVHSIDVRAVNDRGLVTDQTYTLTVSPDTQPPSVGILLSGSTFNPGQSVTVRVVATDDVSVASLSLTFNGSPVTLDANGSTTLTLSGPGVFSLVATATDPAGLVGTGTASIRVLDPNDHTPPTIQITSPISNGSVTYLTNIVGTVTDPNNDLEFYRVEYSRAGTDDWRFVSQGTAPVINGTLGTFDPTLLQNDAYTIRVTAQDFNGNFAVQELNIGVSGNAKIGNFHLEYTDLQIPLAGIPITIKRIYDTLQANESGDFGFGWKLSVFDPNIHKTVPDDGGPFAVDSFKVGTKVYLTNPDGKREGFTFTPTEQDSVPTAIGSLPPPFGPIFHPAFTPDPGVFDRLSVDDVPLNKQPDGHFTLYAFGFPYNVRDFRLTTKDGTVYSYNQFSGLQTITDTNNVTLTVTANGITSSTGVSIQFVRDVNGHITQIIDPAGHALTYEYDATGNLLSALNQVGIEADYQYLTTPAHYLKAANNPEPGCMCQQSAPASFASYDLNGRLIGVSDVLGNSSTQSYDLANLTEHVADPLGNSSTIVYDTRGNIVSFTDPRGGQTQVTWDANNLPIAARDQRGFVTTIAHDSRGNVTQVTDPLGDSVHYTYNQFSEIVTTTDALGHISTANYDANGNLIGFTNADGVITSMTRDQYGRQTSYTNPFGQTTTFLFSDPSASKPSAIIHPDGTKKLLTYNIFGEATDSIDENGNHIKFGYDFNGKMTSMTDQSGATTTLTYVGNHVASLTDPLGRTTSYAYDAEGRLVQKTNPDGGVTKDVYNANNQLVQEIDPLGRSTDYTYDPIGNLTSKTVGDPTTWSYQYDLRGNVIQATDGNGNVTTYEYDAQNRLIKQTNVQNCGCNRVEVYAYDAAGNVTSETDPNGNVTTFTYDAMGNTLTQTNALGITVSWTYDGYGNTTSFTDGNGHTTQYIYSTTRDVTTYSPDTYIANSRSQLAAVIDPLGAKTAYAYDSVGNLISETDALGRVTQYGYDSRGNLTSATDALGGHFAYGYDAVDNLTSRTDALNRTTTYGYDSMNNLVSVTDPLGGVTSYAFDSVGNQTSQTDPLGRTTSYTYNALDQVTSITDPLGGVSHYTYNATDKLLSYTDAMGQQWTYSYDQIDQLLKSTDPNGHSYQYTYDHAGNETSQTDPLGRVLTYGYDAANRLTSVTNNLGQATHYGYDGEANVTSVTDALGNTTRYAYDAANQLTQETDALGHSTTYTYDLVGNVTGITDRNGRQRSFTYDALNRQTQEQWIANGTAIATFNYGYDAVDNLTSAGDANSAYQLTYDVLDRLTSVDNQGTPKQPHIVLSYGYDAVGNETSVRDNTGVQVNSSYNANDWLTSRSWSGPGIDPVQVNFRYNVRGGLTDIQRFANTSSTPQVIGQSHFTYDPAGNLTGLTHADGQNNPLVQYVYQYNAADELTSETHHGQTTNYHYDAIGQLLGTDNGSQPGQSYAYDANGNRTGAAVRVDADNRVLTDGAFNYAYDNEGNLITKTEIATGNVTIYTYDFRNRLTSVTQRDAHGALLHSAQYVYDCFDRRISQTVDGVTTNFVYNGTQVWGDYNAAGNAIAHYLYGDEGANDLLARQRTGEGTVWYLSDHLFSVRDLMNNSGQIVDHVDYDAFGNITNETNPSAGDRFKFTGQEYDTATGLYYFQSRYYDPRQGRFISQDSFGLGGGDTNFYRYVFNSPTNYADPTGHQTIVEYATQLILGAISALVFLDVSCLTDEGLKISVGVGVPFTDLQYSASTTVSGVGTIPTPQSDVLRVQIESCAKLNVAAWSNGIFGEMGTVLAYFNLINSGHPIDCVEFKSRLAVGSLSDYSLDVKVECGGGGPNRYVIQGGDLTLPSIPVGAALGLKDGPESNCFLAGTQVLLATPSQTIAEGTMVGQWFADNRGWLGTASLGVGLLAALAVARCKRKPEDQEDDEDSLDEFFTQYDPETERPWQDGPPPGDNRLPRLTMPSAMRATRGRTNAHARDAFGPDDSLPTTTALLEAPVKIASAHSAVRAQPVPKANRHSTGARNWLALSLLSIFAVLAGFIWAVPTEPAAQSPPTILSKNIEDIEIGDWVMAWDEESGEVLPRQVVQLFRNTSDHVRILTIESPDDELQEIHTTDGHPFWVVNKGWIDAGDLEEGAALLLADGQIVSLISTQRQEFPDGVQTFNFEVEGLHTYFVAQDADDSFVLVHNASKRVQGNTRASRRPNWVYEIYTKATKTKKRQTKKFGITCIPPNSKGVLPRPASQLRKGERYRIVKKVPNRARALDLEYQKTLDYYNRHGKPPPRNQRPKVP
jgi:RHS repeat-associated protein